MLLLSVNFTNDLTGTFLLKDYDTDLERTGTFDVSESLTYSYIINVLLDDDIYRLNEWFPIPMPNPNNKRKDIERYLEGRFGVITPFDKI